MREPLVPSGYCQWGHPQKLSGFIDSEGAWRCRDCRKESNKERSFWKLVNKYMSNPQDIETLEILEKYHWTYP